MRLSQRENNGAIERNKEIWKRYWFRGGRGGAGFLFF